jgi:hypothetical protein
MDDARVKALAEHLASMTDPVIVYGPDVSLEAVGRLVTEMSLHAEIPDSIDVQSHAYLRPGDLLAIDRAVLFDAGH